MQAIEKQVAVALESDTLALVEDLNKAYEILGQPSEALAVFVEQVNTVKLMKETMA